MTRKAYGTCWWAARPFSWPGPAFRRAGRFHLLFHKVIAGRPRDMEDVKHVLVKNRGVDARYIRRWLKEFEAALSQPYQERFDELWEDCL